MKILTPRIDYLKEAAKYQTGKAKKLLITEAPPHANLDAYFYYPFEGGPGRGVNNRLDGIIFKHYFGNYATSKTEYIRMLRKLDKEGIWVFDVYDGPIVVSEKMDGKTIIHEDAVDFLIEQIPNLKRRIDALKIAYENLTILNLRPRLTKELRNTFKEANYYNTWTGFSNDAINPPLQY